MIYQIFVSGVVALSVALAIVGNHDARMLAIVIILAVISTKL